MKAATGAALVPVYDSPAHKLMNKGVESLSDVEVVSLFMGENVELARKTLLFNLQSLRELCRSDVDSFEVLGVSQQSYVQLHAALELSRRFLKERMQRGNVLEDPDKVRDYLASRLRDLPAEKFFVLFLDNGHRVIAFEDMFDGTIDGASVHPREVVRAALKHNAAAVIFAHNHPSGIAEPSQSDERITKRLREALALIDVRVLDHFVVGDNIVSMSERGLL